MGAQFSSLLTGKPYNEMLLRWFQVFRRNGTREAPPPGRRDAAWLQGACIVRARCALGVAPPPCTPARTRTLDATAADTRGAGVSFFFFFFIFFLKHWHFLVTAGFEGMVAADWWQLIVGILVSVVVLLAVVWFSRAEYRK